ncbi:ABC transporter substrate-binding protein [Bradyrhizobium sp. NC92]|uniref:ABC transporter substrate-binding protein n=1 Tax=Bradyrhizobium sp. (strain NC92) TaxID=55395 RepID=UPI0021A99C27|nr:ABC transporter substrate-binding protein [Bradyrhizobium sp. NC92]UWU69834.1 ABC transporter substrate-binding protein [Bradyrhizobium sp. NC92]
MKRRDFMAGLGLATALPAASRAQQTFPTIGFLSTRSPDEAATHTNAFRRGLEEMGYVENRNIKIEYRWAKGDYGSLPSFAAELVGHPLSLIVGAGDPAARAAKSATSAIPLVFLVGDDPVRAGLVTSMNRPGVATGVNFFTGDLGGKRLELICAMVPTAGVIGLLVNPRFGSEVVEQHRQAVANAAKSLGRELVVQAGTTDAELDAAFGVLGKAGVKALVVQNDPFFDSRRSQILALSSEHQLPGIFHIREFPADGGLMSYGASLSDTYRLLGVYAGKILHGAKPDNLPVLRPTKFELVINMKSAKAFGLAVPQSVLVASDELIE